jgi:hypothetical protein
MDYFDYVFKRFKDRMILTGILAGLYLVVRWVFLLFGVEI